MDILGEIRKKDREQWIHFAKEKWTDFRIWIQENGEIAAVSALVAGIIFVLCFKLIFYLALIGAALAFGVWYFALPPGEHGSTGPSRDSDIPPTQH